MATILKVGKDGKLVQQEKKEDFPFSQFLLFMAIGMFMLFAPLLLHLLS